MNLKNIILDDKSKIGKQFYMNLLKLLDNPIRQTLFYRYL